MHFLTLKSWKEGILRERRHNNPHFMKGRSKDNELWVMTTGKLRASTALPRVDMGTVLELPESWTTLGHFKRHWEARQRHPQEVVGLKSHKLLKLLWSPLPSKLAMPGCEELLRPAKALQQTLTVVLGKKSEVSTASVRAWNVSYSAICFLVMATELMQATCIRQWKRMRNQWKHVHF